METITKEQLKKLHAMLSTSGMMDSKRDLILYYTGGRTSSSREMSKGECVNLIDHLLAADPRQRMIRKIYSLSYDIGICHAGDDTEKKINKAALDSWLQRNSYLHKHLDKYSIHELPKLVSQLQQVLKHNQQSATRKEAKQSVDNLMSELGIRTIKNNNL